MHRLYHRMKRYRHLLQKAEITGTIDHVGIVESVSGGTVNTIEGNSGDKVARRSYSIGSGNIYGYGVPAY